VRLTQRLLNLAQAAEVYHRSFHSAQTTLKNEEHVQRITEILNDVRDAHKNWLKEQLEHSNELSLGQRLNAILKEVESTAKALLPNSKKRSSFTFKVAKSRNDLTHRLKTDTKDEILFVIGEILFLLLTACLLNRCKLPEDRVAAILANNFRYIRAAENSLEFL
jgi:Apea-like HEPN